MNVFNCILKDKATVIIPCFTDSCDVGEILDKLSTQYYAKGLRVLVFNDKLDDETLNIIEEKKNQCSSIDISVVNDLHELYDRKTPHIFFIDDSSHLLSKWSLFNLIRKSKKRKKQLQSKD